MTIVLQHKVRHPGLCVHNTRCDTGDRCRVTRCGSVDYCATQTVTPSTMHGVALGTIFRLWYPKHYFCTLQLVTLSVIIVETHISCHGRDGYYRSVCACTICLPQYSGQVDISYASMKLLNKSKCQITDSRHWMNAWRVVLIEFFWEICNYYWMIQHTFLVNVPSLDAVIQVLLCYHLVSMQGLTGLCASRYTPA